jgi:hypothetical protein
MKAKVENLEAFRLLLFPVLTTEELEALWEWFYAQKDLYPPQEQAKIIVNSLSPCDRDYPWPRFFIEDYNSKAALIKAGSFFSATRLKKFLKLEYDRLLEIACTNERDFNEFFEVA